MGGVKRICTWCGVSLDGGNSADDSTAQISHGICAECVRSFFSTKRYPPLDFLDSLEAPVLVMDADAVVLEANARARAVLGKDAPAIVGYRGGDVIECVLSKLPGGCGLQEHCKTGCIIRRSVSRTASTGFGVTNALSIHQVQTPAGVQERLIAISTEKVAEMVLLRIDSVTGADEIEGAR